MTETPKYVGLTEKGIAVLKELAKYPESEKTDAYIAITSGTYEQWQEERLKILDEEIIT